MGDEFKITTNIKTFKYIVIFKINPSHIYCSYPSTLKLSLLETVLQVNLYQDPVPVPPFSPFHHQYTLKMQNVL